MRMDIRAVVKRGTRSVSGRFPNRSQPRSGHGSTDLTLLWCKREAQADLDRHPVSLIYRILRFDTIFLCVYVSGVVDRPPGSLSVVDMTRQPTCLLLVKVVHEEWAESRARVSCLQCLW